MLQNQHQLTCSIMCHLYKFFPKTKPVSRTSSDMVQMRAHMPSLMASSEHVYGNKTQISNKQDIATNAYSLGNMYRKTKCTEEKTRDICLILQDARPRNSFYFVVANTNSLRHLPRRSSNNCDLHFAKVLRQTDRFKENYSIDYIMH